MASWKQVAVAAAERALNVTIARKGSVRLRVEEEVLTEFFRAFRVDCVFDVGANTGQYARRLRGLGYRGSIVSFEPIPQHASRLRDMSRGDERWFVEECALSDEAATATFHVLAHDQFSSLHAPSHDETGLFASMNAVVEKVDVQTARLETHFQQYTSRLAFERPFLKMDTQGNDLAVARGAGERLRAFVGLQSELAIKRLYESQSDYREAIDFYEAQGFALCSLVPNNAGHFPDLIEMDCIMYNREKRSAASTQAEGHSSRTA